MLHNNNFIKVYNASMVKYIVILIATVWVSLHLVKAQYFIVSPLVVYISVGLCK